MIRPWPYVALGILLAALVAGSIVGLEVAAFAVFMEGMSPQGFLYLTMLSGLTAAVVFLMGLTFPGSLIWLWLHGIGKTSWSAAGLTGAIGAALAGLALTVSAGGLYALLTVTVLALPGAAAGLTIRWVAYRPLTPPRRPTVRPS